ncbi:MAG: tetratricopeptide repeat protein [Deltaproteobacteria bacterium]|nr:tetratricopeptide repeat protein [Deltaproteobacteria bacterium]MBW1962258.1 tetratricopeptide repeat protein [Deltaproteobacteria bacterium]MBW1994249.1 tetratricopeptide repeat protein [Deltaproteobacteria bacterium]MBW2150978.1 tetratricopeptide repeat protein [Deltaproteobacteria bacterium]
MAKKKRVTRKELLKEPDEFITFAGKMIRFAKAHRSQLLYGLGALVFVVLIISAVHVYANWRENQAFDLLEKAMSRYDENRSDKADLVDDVKQALQTVAEKYSRYHGGKLARVMYANLSYDTGDFNTAIENYLKALEAFHEDPSISLFIQISLGYAYEAKKDYKTAIKYFEQVASSPMEFLKDEALYQLGRLYAKTGQQEKSKEAFDNILSNHPDSIYIELVKESVQSLL